MTRKCFIAAMIINVFIISLVNADLFLTVNSQNPTGVPLMLQGTGPYQIAIDGNTVIEPNSVRLEAVGGTIADVNNQLSFQYDTGSTDGLIWLITNVDLVINDINIPANTTIYEIFIFCNPDAEITGVCGSDYSMLYPPQEEDEGQGNFMLERTQEQSSVNTTNEFINYETSYINMSGMTLPFELPEPNIPHINNDNRLDFKDFALFSNNWLSTGTGLTGDFDKDNKVDCNDLYILSYYWLEGPPPKTEFEQFKAALTSGDVNAAASYFSAIQSENYHIFFEQLRPYLQQMANDMGELIFIKINSDMAIYDILREENGQLYGYPVIFIRNENGEWKICDF